MLQGLAYLEKINHLSKYFCQHILIIHRRYDSFEFPVVLEYSSVTNDQIDIHDLPAKKDLTASNPT